MGILNPMVPESDEEVDRGQDEYEAQLERSKVSHQWPPPTIAIWIRGGAVNTDILRDELEYWAAYMGAPLSAWSPRYLAIEDSLYKA